MGKLVEAGFLILEWVRFTLNSVCTICRFSYFPVNRSPAFLLLVFLLGVDYCRRNAKPGLNGLPAIRTTGWPEHFFFNKYPGDEKLHTHTPVFL